MERNAIDFPRKSDTDARTHFEFAIDETITRLMTLRKMPLVKSRFGDEGFAGAALSAAESLETAFNTIFEKLLNSAEVAPDDVEDFTGGLSDFYAEAHALLSKKVELCEQSDRSHPDYEEHNTLNHAQQGIDRFFGGR